MKKLLFIMVAVFVANSAIAQYTLAEVEAIEGRKIGALRPVRSDAYWQKGADGLYYKVISEGQVTTAEEAGILTQADLTDPSETKEIVLGWVGDGARTNAINNTFQDSIIGGGLNGWFAQNTTTTTLTSGYYKAFSVYSQANTISVGVSVPIAAISSYTATNNNKINMYSPSGSLIATSGNIPDLWQTDDGWLNVYWETEVELSDSVYSIAMLFSGTGTGATLYRSSYSDDQRIRGMKINVVSGANQTDLPTTLNIQSLNESTTWPYIKLIGYKND